MVELLRSPPFLFRLIFKIWLLTNASISSCELLVYLSGIFSDLLEVIFSVFLTGEDQLEITRINPTYIQSNLDL